MVFLLEDFEEAAISVGQMLIEANPENKGLGKDKILQIKEKIYEHIAEVLVCEGYPTKSTKNFKEANITDLVFCHGSD